MGSQYRAMHPNLLRLYQSERGVPVEKWQGKAWAATIFFLIALIILGGVVFFLRQGAHAAGEIVLTTPEPHKIQVYIEGAVAKPGLYDLQESASLEEALQAAGGASAEADLSQIKITVPRTGETSSSQPQSQKININTAPPKLLETLPGIGPKRAEDIVAYRTKNGPFRTTDELIKVSGIGPVTYEKVKDYIIVGD